MAVKRAEELALKANKGYVVAVEEVEERQWPLHPAAAKAGTSAAKAVSCKLKKDK